MDLALSTLGLRRTFGELVAVDSIDLEVPRGSFYGFLGPNGAGKSTTIKCLTGLLRPSDGSMTILGRDPLVEPVEVKRRIGVLPEDQALFDRLDGPETLAFVGRIWGLDDGQIDERGRQLLEIVDLQATPGTLVADYSHGMRKKLALAAALLPAPRLLFLDEPFEGIDAVASRHIRRLLASYVAQGGTVFLTSHILQIVEALCDRIGIIHRGRLVAQGPIEQLRAEAGADRSLESMFFELVGADEHEHAPLDWLGS